MPVTVLLQPNSGESGALANQMTLYLMRNNSSRFVFITFQVFYVGFTSFGSKSSFWNCLICNKHGLQIIY